MHTCTHTITHLFVPGRARHHGDAAAGRGPIHPRRLRRSLRRHEQRRSGRVRYVSPRERDRTGAHPSRDCIVCHRRPRLDGQRQVRYGVWGLLGDERFTHSCEEGWGGGNTGGVPSTYCIELTVWKRNASSPYTCWYVCDSLGGQHFRSSLLPSLRPSLL